MKLDAGLAAFAEELKARSLRPLSPVTAPLAECRAMTERIGAVLNEGSAPLALELDLVVDGEGGPVPCRLYLPDGVANPPLIVYAHGGSFALGALNSWDGMLRVLVRASGVAALSVGYRLAPEYRFPVAFNDMRAAVQYAAREGVNLGIDSKRLAIGGDSAGGNLALATAVALRDEGQSPLSFMLLIYGVYSTDNAGPTWKELGTGNYGLSAAQMDWIWTNYLNTPAEKKDFRVAPLWASMTGLPPAHLIAGELDPLKADSQALAQRLNDVKVPNTLTVYEGLTHGFIRSGPYSDTVKRAVSGCATVLARAFA